MIATNLLLICLSLCNLAVHAVEPAFVAMLYKPYFYYMNYPDMAWFDSNIKVLHFVYHPRFGKTWKQDIFAKGLTCLFVDVIIVIILLT